MNGELIKPSMCVNLIFKVTKVPHRITQTKTPTLKVRVKSSEGKLTIITTFSHRTNKSFSNFNIFNKQRKRKS